ncbi:MAG: hypothetical protein AAF907_11355, partial [Planctomycetota bacterium]
ESGGRSEAVRKQLHGMCRGAEVIGEPRAVLFRSTLPTDVRHNTKIDRAALADWAETVLTSPLRRRLARA